MTKITINMRFLQPVIILVPLLNSKIILKTGTIVIFFFVPLFVCARSLLVPVYENFLYPRY